MRRTVCRRTIALATTVVLLLGATLVGQSGDGQRRRPSIDERMSSGGAAAARMRLRLSGFGRAGALVGDTCVNVADCGDDFGGSQAETQAETSIAVDPTGQHVVVGSNDFRGFFKDPVSFSGVIYSDDGGQTFVDGGQLPTPGTDVLFGMHFPQIYGDPDIEYLGGCTFVYSSLVLAKFSDTQIVQTLGVHRSIDCGHTWQGPFVIGPATNPNGQVDANGSPLDAADKEFMSVDPETGRVLISWSNFTPLAPAGVEISTAYSDDIATAAVPTWSTRQVVAATTTDGQAAAPAFASGSSNAYVVWQRFPFQGPLFGYGSTVGFARSTDNGATWSAPTNLTPQFFTVDYILGNDRVHIFPSIAVDNSNGAHAGSIYVVYENNGLHDGGDIVFQRSTDGGDTFSAPLRLNSRPGADRSQWFPWVSVDRSSGRIHVFFYDQGIAASGDLMQVLDTYSDDGGTTWGAPLTLSKRPFKAGWGKDGAEPNLGDYNQAVAQDGDLFATWAETSPPPGGFVDGQPSISLTVPDLAFRRYRPVEDPGDTEGIKPATLDLQRVAVVDSGGNGLLDPGETARLRITLRNYVTNPLSAATVTGITARLSTTTPGVTVTQPASTYPNMAPGASASNSRDFLLALSSSFIAGTPIELQLAVRSADYGAATLLYRQLTGTPVPTLLLAENFNAASPGSLPAGWVSAHGAGSVVVPWTTSDTFCGSSNGAFHSNDNIGPTSSARSRWERLLSPVFAVPANAQYLSVDFDVCYDSEDDPNFNVLAYDGFFLRLADLTPGHRLRSVLAEAFEDEFTTGALFHYPRHLPRSGDPSYFPDQSAWAGFSDGVRHVHMRLPGVAGTTMQLRFEYTQDRFGTCANVRPGHTCGVFIDNVVVNSVVSKSP